MKNLSGGDNLDKLVTKQSESVSETIDVMDDKEFQEKFKVIKTRVKDVLDDALELYESKNVKELNDLCIGLHVIN